MNLFREIDALPEIVRGSAVTIGNFDGVHRGHARLVERLTAKARSIGGPAIVFTFDPHPVMLLRPDEVPPPLTWTERKAELLTELGVDCVVAYPTDRELLELEAREFFDRILVEKLAAKSIVEGPNFYFGKGRQGDVRTLAEYCAAASIDLEIVDPLVFDGAFISSSRVRRAIQEGDVELARNMLTRPYRVRGMVTHGARRGASIGFPTANMAAIDTLVPAAGVYAGRAITGTAAWPAAINIGPNPTFAEPSQKFEVHLIGFHDSLYGQPLEVDFFTRLRDIQTFGSVEQLTRQLKSDIVRTGDIYRAVAHKEASPPDLTENGTEK